MLLQASSYSSQNVFRKSKSDFLEFTKITHVPHLVVILWPYSTGHDFIPFRRCGIVLFEGNCVAAVFQPDRFVRLALVNSFLQLIQRKWIDLLLSYYNWMKILVFRIYPPKQTPTQKCDIILNDFQSPMIHANLNNAIFPTI